MAIQERVLHQTLREDGETTAFRPEADIKSVQVVEEGSPDGTWILKKSNDKTTWIDTDVTGAAASFVDGVPHDARWWKYVLSGQTPASGAYHFYTFLRG